VQALYLLGYTDSGVAIQAVGDQKHDGALAEDAPRPALVEVGETLADARAARPVLDRLCHLVEGDVDILVAQIARHVGEPRAEEESIDAVAVVRDGVHEMQENPAVAAHRAGDVAQHDERRRAAARAAPFELDEAA